MVTRGQRSRAFGLFKCICVHRNIPADVYNINIHLLCYIHIYQAFVILLLLSQSQINYKDCILVFNLFFFFIGDYFFCLFVYLFFVCLFVPSWEGTVHCVSSLWLILKSKTTRRRDYHMKMSFSII